MDNLVIKNPEQFGETLESIGKAISDAGGTVPLTELFNMTLLEFLSVVACSNGIRFYHKNSYSLTKSNENSKMKQSELTRKQNAQDNY